MQTALVDSNVLIAAANGRDRNHEMAASIVDAADRRDLPRLIVTNYVLVETLNYIIERASQTAAVELYDRLDRSPGFTFERVVERDDHGAIEDLRSGDRCSFVDATLGAYAARQGVTYCYSFDEDLDRIESLTRLADPVDPFEPE